MSDEPNRERRELLERLLTGELDPHGEEGRGLLERDAALREELEELREVAGVLDEAAAAEAELLAAVPEDGEDARQAREALQAIWSQEDARCGRRRFPMFWIGLAAGVLFAAILGLALLRGNGDSGPRNPIELGGELLRAEAPVGGVTEYSVFRWESDLPRGYSFVLEIRDPNRPGADGRGELRYSQDGILDTSWKLPEDLARGLPDSIEWSVSAIMPGGETAMPGPVVSAHRLPR